MGCGLIGWEGRIGDFRCRCHLHQERAQIKERGVWGAVWLVSPFWHWLAKRRITHLRDENIRINLK